MAWNWAMLVSGLFGLSLVGYTGLSRLSLVS